MLWATCLFPPLPVVLCCWQTDKLRSEAGWWWWVGGWKTSTYRNASTPGGPKGHEHPMSQRYQHYILGTGRRYPIRESCVKSPQSLLYFRTSKRCTYVRWIRLHGTGSIFNLCPKIPVRCLRILVINIQLYNWNIRYYQYVCFTVEHSGTVLIFSLFTT